MNFAALFFNAVFITNLHRCQPETLALLIYNHTAFDEKSTIEIKMWKFTFGQLKRFSDCSHFYPNEKYECENIQLLFDLQHTEINLIRRSIRFELLLMRNCILFAIWHNNFPFLTDGEQCLVCVLNCDVMRQRSYSYMHLTVVSFSCPIELSPSTKQCIAHNLYHKRAYHTTVRIWFYWVHSLVLLVWCLAHSIKIIQFEMDWISILMEKGNQNSTYFSVLSNSACFKLRHLKWGCVFPLSITFLMAEHQYICMHHNSWIDLTQ